MEEPLGAKGTLECQVLRGRKIPEEEGQQKCERGTEPVCISVGAEGC